MAKDPEHTPGEAEFASLQREGAPSRQEEEVLVLRTLDRAKRELGARDVVSFGMGRIWAGLVEVGSALLVAFTPEGGGMPGTKPQHPKWTAGGEQ